MYVSFQRPDTHTKSTLVEFDPGCEAMVYTTDGTPLQGQISQSFGHNRLTPRQASPVGMAETAVLNISSRKARANKVFTKL